MGPLAKYVGNGLQSASGDLMNQQKAHLASIDQDRKAPRRKQIFSIDLIIRTNGFADVNCAQIFF